MGWPKNKKREQYRLYYERKAKTYLLVFVEAGGSCDHDCVGEILINNDPDNPRLAHMTCSENYIYANRLKRVQWDEIPKVWQDAFKIAHFDIEPVERPEDIPGLWRIGNFKGKEVRDA